MNVVPITPFFPRLAPRQDRSLGRYHHAGNVEQLVTAIAHLEQVDLVEQWLRPSSQRRQNNQRKNPNAAPNSLHEPIRQK
jgi:hypothetical protein